MNAVANILQLLVIAYSFQKGFGVVSFFSSLSGSFVGNFEGAVNATTITCNVTRNGFQTETAFTVTNFRGDPILRPVFTLRDQNVFLINGPHNNELIITNWTSEVDRVIVYCGTPTMVEANVTLRLYRPPNLQDNFELKIVEGDLNVPINLRLDPEAFPKPSIFEWLKEGQPLRQNGITTTYSSVTFGSVMRSDSGNYTVSATNFVLDNATQPVGSDSGSFSLDVLYPPSFVTEGPTERYVLFGDSLSLVCGTGLDSNPRATITWTAPDETTVVDNNRYDLENGPEIVRLNFTETILSDNGVWRCEAKVESERYLLSGGMLVRQDLYPVGSITRDIQLKIITVPGPPSVPAVDSIGATWAHICWDSPLMVNSPISRYQIIGREVNGVGVVTVNTTTNATAFNVTGLLPATTYSFTVVAISEGGDVIAISQEGPPFEDATGITVPEVECSNPVSADGIITVQWNFVHTGGLNLTGLSAEYSFVDGSATEVRPVTVDGLSTTTIKQRGLVAGFDYTFSITAENSNGSSTVTCSPVQHSIGVPREPQFDEVNSGPGAGEVTLEVKTVASGVDNPSQGFRFIITPVLDGEVLDPIPFDLFEYQSGTFESITVSGLEPGRTYSFSATAMNTFGTSSSTNSPSVSAGGPPPTSENPIPPTQGSNIGAVVGGAVGGVLAVVIIVAIIMIAIVLALLLFRKNDRGEYRPNKAVNENYMYEPAPTKEKSTTKVEEVAIDLGDDMGSKLKEENEIQYADLESIRVPNQQRNNSVKNSKPVEPEEPVQYAEITNFVKKAKEAVVDNSAVPKPAESPPPYPTTADGDADKTGTSTTLV